MSILFTVKIAAEDEVKLQEKYPSLDFVFCENMKEASDYVSDAEVIVTLGNDVDEHIVDQAEKLKWIGVLSAGVNDMPLEALKNKGIIVTNAKGIHKIPMAEYAISMLLQVYRQERELIEAEDKHEWQKFRRPLEISGKTMLIAGTGAIGQEVARLAKAFNMTTIGVSRSGRSVEYFDENVSTNKLKSKLPEADFVVSVLPSTQETHYFYTDELFQAMKDTAVFLNMGRGDVVSSEVILNAIQNNQIKHVVLDVFEQEPLPEDHPLWDAEGVTITPHLSGISPHYLERALEVLEENLTIFVEQKGPYINTVDLSKGY